MNNFYNKHRYNCLDKAIRVLTKLRRKQTVLKQFFINNQVADRTLVTDLIMQGKRGRALLMLRRKKFIENELEKLDNAFDEIDDILHTSEYKDIKMDFINQLKRAKYIFKCVHAVVMIPRIGQLLESTVSGLKKRSKLLKMLAGGLSRYDEMKVVDEMAEVIQYEFKRRPDYPRTLEDDFYLHDIDLEFNFLGTSPCYS